MAAFVYTNMVDSGVQYSWEQKEVDFTRKTAEDSRV